MSYQITVLGPSSAGKTTLISSLYHNLKQRLPKEIKDIEHCDSLEGEYEKLAQSSRNPDHVVLLKEEGLQGTKEAKTYKFSLNDQGESLNVDFYDYVGGWVTGKDFKKSEQAVTDYHKVVAAVKAADVVLVVINTPYLMDAPDRKGVDQANNELCAIKCIEDILKEGLKPDNKDRERLVVFVPLKCEKWMETPELRKDLTNRVKALFDSTLKLGDNPDYKIKGRNPFAMLLLPVQTMGNMVFSTFRKDYPVDEGESVSAKPTERTLKIVEETYAKKAGSAFNPQNVDLLANYILSFLLRQRENFWTLLRRHIPFVQKGLDGVAKTIRSGLKFEHESERGVEICCGRELLKGNTLYKQWPRLIMLGVVLILLILGWRLISANIQKSAIIKELDVAIAENQKKAQALDAAAAEARKKVAELEALAEENKKLNKRIEDVTAESQKNERELAIAADEARRLAQQRNNAIVEKERLANERERLANERERLARRYEVEKNKSWWTKLWE